MRRLSRPAAAAVRLKQPCVLTRTAAAAAQGSIMCALHCGSLSLLHKPIEMSTIGVEPACPLPAYSPIGTSLAEMLLMDAKVKAGECCWLHCSTAVQKA